MDGLNEGHGPSVLMNSFLVNARKQVSKELLELPNNPAKLTKRHFKAWNAIIRIIDSHSHEEPMTKFTSSVGDRDLADDLMNGNVFAYHPSRNTVGLQSRPMDIYISQIVGDQNSTQRKALLDTLNQYQSKL